MFRTGAIRWVVALALAAGLASPALAAPRVLEAEEGLRLGSLWEAMVSWLASGWTIIGGEAGDGERGAQMDPNGGTNNSDSDRGAQMDPDG